MRIEWIKKMQRDSASQFKIVCLGLLFLFSAFLYGEETLVLVAQESNVVYYKPEVKISPTGDVYVVYQAKNNATGRSEIYLSKYGINGSVAFVKNLSESSAYSYEPEIDIRGNGDIHVAWCDQSGDTHVIKYRYFNGSTWSGIYTFGQVSIGENIEDLRLAVDEAGNVFVVFMYWPDAKCIFISKYGDSITFEHFPEGGRLKHADVDADGNYVHIVWQYRPNGGDEYTIGYQRRGNRLNSAWENWIDVRYSGTQRPRMCLDNTGVPHVVFFHNLGSTRKLWYKKRTGNEFGDLQVMSSPDKFETYHYCDISAVNPDNMLVTMQRGGSEGGTNINYNWKKNGVWTGFSSFSKSYGPNPSKQSIDLAPGRFFAAIAFADRDERVYLLLVEESGNPIGGAPSASFIYSPQSGNVPLPVTFDASLSSDPGGSITAYNWNFGDGFTGTGRTISHTYTAEGEYTVALTVTDNEGKTGTISHVVVAVQPNLPPVAAFSFSPKSGIFPLTVLFDASASSDPDGIVAQYEWEFGNGDSGTGRVVTHTFTEEGANKIVLTVYDNDGDSASASGTVNVFGLLPPLNIAFESIANRSLFTLQYVYKITWNHNPGNAALGADVVKYNIYRKRPADKYYAFLATVSAAENNRYLDRLGNVAEEYVYTVTGVDTLGRESKISSTSAQNKSSKDREVIRK